jgi:cystine transport system substrate-binding protein
MAPSNSSPSSAKLPVYHLPFPICHFLLVICHLSFVICLPACTRPDDTWNRVHETGVLHVGMDASFPPFETIAPDGTLVGFDVDLARELAQRIGPALSAPREAEGPTPSGVEGIEVQFVANLPYDGLYDALAVGRVDVVISALVVNPARMADFAYSTPYFDAGQVLVVRAVGTGIEGHGPEPVEGMADLGGHTLAVEFGTQGDLEARKWARRLSDLTVVPYQTSAEALAAVAAGETDAALVDHVSALAAVAAGETDAALVDHVSALAARAQTLRVSEGPKGFELAIVGDPIIEEPYAVAVHRGSRHLLRAINRALAEMQADGTLETLTARWIEEGH